LIRIGQTVFLLVIIFFINMNNFENKYGLYIKQI
jgi:hypothetical protein